MRVEKRDTVPAPLVVNPSQNWYGPDGSWSTMQIEVGTPAQSFDVLPSTAGSETWIPLPEGCTASDPEDCPTLRGVLPFNGQAAEGFTTGNSSTWSLTGLYALNLETELGLQANAQYGTDVVGLNGGNGSTTGGSGISLAKQIVGGIAAKDYLLGGFGLGIQPTSFSSSASQSQSYLVNLKNNKLIPSLSYGFTAGASYRNKKVPASLTLGGFDQSRFTPSNRSFTFASQDAEVLTVGVQSIVADETLIGTTSFTVDGGSHMTVIDSTIPHLWLPRIVCDRMASALGLTYDDQSDLYLVNDTIHAQLQSSNPVFTFKVGDQSYDDGNSTNIQLPYAAFDLQVGWPVYSTSQNYFPIRRAANDTQLRLGRTLLQEAYLVVDYESRNFTIGQTVFTDPLPSPRIVTINANGNSISGNSSLGAGAIAGIAVGAAALIIGSIIAFISWKRRKRSQARAELEANEARQHGSTLKNTKYAPLDGEATEMSTDVNYQRSELPVQTDRKHGAHGVALELPSPRPVYEMMGDTPYEMEGDTPHSTLPPSPYRQGHSPNLSPAFSPGPYRGSPQPSPMFRDEKGDR